MDPIWPPPPALAPLRPPVAAPRLGAFEWRLAPFVDLCFYPERFFRERLDAVSASLTTGRLMLVMFVIGLERMFDQLDRITALLRDRSGTTVRLGILLAVLMYPVVLGPVAYYLGRFGYRLRLRFCGVTPDPERSSAAFVVTSVVFCVPTVLIGGLAALFEADSWQTLWFILSTAGWTCYLDYVAARVVFDAPRRRAIVWFAVVPIIAIALAGGVLSVLRSG